MVAALGDHAFIALTSARPLSKLAVRGAATTRLTYFNQPPSINNSPTRASQASSLRTQDSPTNLPKSSQNPGYVFPTHSGSLIETPGRLNPTSDNAIAIR
jgi:PPE-repeat protein